MLYKSRVCWEGSNEHRKLLRKYNKKQLIMNDKIEESNGKTWYQCIYECLYILYAMGYGS